MLRQPRLRKQQRGSGGSCLQVENMSNKSSPGSMNFAYGWPSKNRGGFLPPQIIHLFIGISIIFNHPFFGGKIPLFLVQHPISLNANVLQTWFPTGAGLWEIDRNATEAPKRSTVASTQTAYLERGDISGPQSLWGAYMVWGCLGISGMCEWIPENSSSFNFSKDGWEDDWWMKHFRNILIFYQ